MKEKIICFCILLSMCITGCSSKDVRGENESLDVAEIEQTEEATGEEVQLTEDDEFTFGYVSDGTGNMNTYVYDGECIEVPFTFTAMNATGHDIGFLVFLGGKLQSYTIEYADGTRTEESYMQKFYCDGQGEEQFSFEIIPNVGKKGEKMGIYVCSIVYPSFQPESIEKPSYQYYGSLGQVVPQQVEFQEDAPQNSEEISVDTTDGLELSEDIAKYIEYFSGGNLEQTLQGNVYVQLYQENLGDNIVYGEDGKITLHLCLYGGVDDTFYTTILVNNQPIQVNGADFIKTELSANTMSECDITLELDDLEELNTIYAVSIPAGDSYLEYVLAVKSDNILLVNK